MSNPHFCTQSYLEKPYITLPRTRTICRILEVVRFLSTASSTQKTAKKEKKNLLLMQVVPTRNIEAQSFMQCQNLNSQFYEQCCLKNLTLHYLVPGQFVEL